VVHAVSAFYERSGHMSPVAAALAAGLHVATALALFLVSPLNRHDVDTDVGSAIDVTIEQPKPPEEPPPPPQEAAKPQPPQPPAQPTPPAQPPAAAQPAPPPPPPPAVAQTPKPEPKPPAPQVSKKPLGVSPPPPEAKTEEAKLEPKLEPQPEPKLEPKLEAAVAQPAEPTTPPPEQQLEKVLPPVEQPAAPLSMRDFVKALPPPPAPPPSPPVPHPTPPVQHAAPHPPAQTPQHSPLSNPQPQPQSQASASAGPSVSTFVNPAERDRQNRAKDAYLWSVIRKFSQYLPDLREKNEGGTVLLRFAIARDGRLVEASIAKSSGIAALDRGLLDSLRAASPYAPLPPEIPGAQVTFVQPIGAARR
jgi:TonB family protein